MIMTTMMEIILKMKIKKKCLKNRVYVNDNS